MFRRIAILAGTVFLLCSCNLSPQQLLVNPSDSPAVTEPALLESATEAVDAPTTAPVGDVADASDVMAGICFESAQDATGRVFVMRNEAELAHFFDLSDNSHLCLHPVERHSFDFSDGRILAGIWSYGHGCKAHHDIVSIDRDDSTKQLTLHLRFVTEGDCDYELVRPFWAGLRGVNDYQIAIEIE